MLRDENQMLKDEEAEAAKLLKASRLKENAGQMMADGEYVEAAPVGDPVPESELYRGVVPEHRQALAALGLCITRKRS